MEGITTKHIEIKALPKYCIYSLFTKYMNTNVLYTI